MRDRGELPKDAKFVVFMEGKLVANGPDAETALSGITVLRLESPDHQALLQEVGAENVVHQIRSPRRVRKNPFF